MSSRRESLWTDLGDAFAVEIQKLRSEGKIDDEQPLIRLDYRAEAAAAPFQFDVAQGKLHRSTCTAVVKGQGATVYGVWKTGRDDFDIACKKCNPVFPKDGAVIKDKPSDILFGILSILDQFGSVLSERGKEYLTSERGRSIAGTLKDVMERMDRKERETVDTVLETLDELIHLVKGLNKTKERNGNGVRHEGLEGKGKGEVRKAAKTKKRRTGRGMEKSAKGRLTKGSRATIL